MATPHEIKCQQEGCDKPGIQVTHSESWRCAAHTAHPSKAACWECGGFWCAVHNACREGHDSTCRHVFPLLRNDKPPDHIKRLKEKALSQVFCDIDSLITEVWNIAFENGYNNGWDKGYADSLKDKAAARDR